jgi:hypothetical protein
MRARSLPPFPSIVSFPAPPTSVSIPLPPAIVSFPAPPLIVVGMLSVKASVVLVDADEVVAATAVDGDLRDRGPLEAEVGCAVVTDVELEDARDHLSAGEA